MDTLTLLWLMLKASLLSTGGLGNLPILHADLIERGWATDRQFAEALAVGQVSPGPTGLWIVSLGYLLAGWSGAGLALLAILPPPLLVLVLDGLHDRFGTLPAVRGFVRGLSLAVVGIFLVVLARLLGGAGFDVRSLLIMLVTLGLGATRRVPVIVLLLLGALAGIAIYG